MALVDVFGDTLLTADGVKPTAEALAGTTAVGVYFSAHWCPPCRGFTPQLADMYKNAFKAKGMTIIFVSSDKDEKSFTDYFSDMPWFALPYDKRALKESLSKKYKVSGIPSFVILDPDGAVLTTDGRKAVMSDPAGSDYPWIPPTPAEKAKKVLDTLGPELVEKAGGRPIGLYFSAHWCPPCRGFTPKLAEYYNAGLKEKMEIIFVSSDKSDEDFNGYFKDMPWLALPYAKRAEKDTLSEALGVAGIPSFCILNPDGTLVTSDGRSKVEKDPKADTFPDGWLPQPFNDVNDDPSDLNGEQCLLALGSNAALAAAVKSVAEEYHVAAGKDVSAMPIRFFEAPAGSISDQLRNLTKITGDKIVFMDIPSDGAFYVCENAAPDAAALKAFLADVSAGKIEKKKLQK